MPKGTKPSREDVFTRDWTANPRELWPAIFEQAGMVGRRNLRFLEIGTYEGRTAVFLMDTVLTHPSSRLTVIDTFQGSPEFATLDVNMDYRDRFLKNIATYGPKVMVLEGTSRDMLPKVKGPLDFAYIDGSHYADDVWADTTQVWPLLRQGGLLAFDDYGWGCGGDDSPKPAIDRFLTEHDDFELLHLDYQCIVRKT